MFIYCTRDSKIRDAKGAKFNDDIMQSLKMLKKTRSIIFQMKRIHALVFSFMLPSPLRVIMASLIPQVVLWIFWFNAIPDDTPIQFIYDKDSSIPFHLRFGPYILQSDRILVIILLFNVVADYVSFSKTRLMIGALAESKRAFVHLLVII